jgi:photosystem II stability/assembly factor-like uncharacterized protein
VRSLVLAAVSLIALAGCHRADAPAEAPTGVKVAEGDGLVVVSWDTLPDLTYWIFFAEGTSVGVGNPGSFAIRRALSPRVIPGLRNDAQFAFIMNATLNDSAAGPSSVPVVKQPRLAGFTGSWTSGPALPVPPLPPQNLKSAAFSGTRFVVVGDAATIFAGDYDYTSDFRDPTNPPGVTSWQPPVVQAGIPFPLASTVNLTSVIFNGSFVALGTDTAPGATSSPVTFSTDGINNWTSMKPVPALGMNALGFGGSLSVTQIYVAVGDQGQIFTSTNPSTIDWTPSTSGTTNALNSVSFLNGKFIATGANGTLLTSSDGMTWDPPLVSNTSSTLRSVAAFTPLGSAQYVAVGDGGVITTTSDISLDWTAITLPAAPNLRSVTVGGASGTRFLAVGLGGTVAFANADQDLTSTLTWTIASAGSADLAKVLTAPGMYLAVGAGGANVVSR